MRLGALRSYPTRHGHGPFPTADAALDKLSEPHNSSEGWQGKFRRGQPDRLLLRYAVSANGGIDALLLSHLDVFARVPALRCCTAYALDASQRIDALPTASGHDLDHQAHLTALLGKARPIYANTRWNNADAAVADLSAWLEAPVLFGAYGPTAQTVLSMEQMPKQ